MSQKRRSKIEKLKTKKVKANNRRLVKKNIELIACPYENIEEIQEDMLIMQSAIIEYYGNIPEDFSPPLYESDEHGLMLAGWVGAYRDLLLKKYKLFDLVEPRVKYSLLILADKRPHN